MRQGNRASKLRNTSEKLFKRGFIPAADLSFSSNAPFDRSVLLENREREPSKNGTNCGAIPLANPTRILCQGDIQDVMLRVLNAPVRAQVVAQLSDLAGQTADKAVLPFFLLTADFPRAVDGADCLNLGPA